MKFFEKTITSKKIFEGKIINVRIDEVELCNGERASREIVEHSGAVAIIPLINREKIFMVKQFRKPLDKELLELPAGKLESGEDPKDCALRELEEEIGYRAGSIKKLISIYTSPGFADEIIHIFIAKDLVMTMTSRDQDEFMDIFEINLMDTPNMILKGEITDAKTIAGLLTYLHR